MVQVVARGKLVSNAEARGLFCGSDRLSGFATVILRYRPCRGGRKYCTMRLSHATFFPRNNKRCTSAKGLGSIGMSSIQRGGKEVLRVASRPFRTKRVIRNRVS